MSKQKTPRMRVAQDETQDKHATAGTARLVVESGAPTDVDEAKGQKSAPEQSEPAKAAPQKDAPATASVESKKRASRPKARVATAASEIPEGEGRADAGEPSAHKGTRLGGTFARELCEAMGAEVTDGNWLHRTFPGHEYAVLGGILGLVVALLVFLVGFWRMLLVAALVCVGVAIGQAVDGDARILRALGTFWHHLIASDQDQ